MKTNPHTFSSVVQQARSASPYDAELREARQALVDAQQALKKLRADLDDVPNRLPTQESRATVATALCCSHSRPKLYKSARDYLRSEGLLFAADRAVNHWGALKRREPGLEFKVKSAQKDIRMLQKVRGLAKGVQPALKYHPFMVKTLAFVADQFMEIPSER